MAALTRPCRFLQQFRGLNDSEPAPFSAITFFTFFDLKKDHDFLTLTGMYGAYAENRLYRLPALGQTQYNGTPKLTSGITMRSRTILKIAGIVVCTVLCTRIAYYAMTEGFSLNRIETPVSFPSTLSIPPPSEEVFQKLASITQQPFRYMKKGSQAYAFVSEDGQYVLKLFKLHHLQDANWLHFIPAFGVLRQYRDSLIERRNYRINLTLNSYKLAAERLPSECALVYAQILPSSSYSLPATIHDAVGRSYTIDLAHHGFALQRRGNLVIPCFEQWIRTHDLEKGKESIDSLVALIARRSSQGIQDTDPDLHKNAGLLNGKAIFIDIGSFYESAAISQTSEMKSHMKKVFSRFSSWLDRRSPELASHLAQRIENPESTRWTPPE